MYVKSGLDHTSSPTIPHLLFLSPNTTMREMDVSKHAQHKHFKYSESNRTDFNDNILFKLQR